MIQRAPNLADVFVQTGHEAGGDYALEHRDGAPERHFQIRLDAREPVIAATGGWARTGQGWDGALEWRVLEFGTMDQPAELEFPDEEREQLVARVQLPNAGGCATRAELAEEFLVSGDSRPVSVEQAVALVDRLWP